MYFQPNNPTCLVSVQSSIEEYWHVKSPPNRNKLSPNVWGTMTSASILAEVGALSCTLQDQDTALTLHLTLTTKDKSRQESFAHCITILHQVWKMEIIKKYRKISQILSGNFMYRNCSREPAALTSNTVHCIMFTIIHWTRYVFSDWLKAYSEFRNQHLLSSCRLYNNHVKNTQVEG